MLVMDQSGKFPAYLISIIDRQNVRIATTDGTEFIAPLAEIQHPAQSGWRFNDFQATATKFGIVARGHNINKGGAEHWQLTRRGGPVVNYWPYSDRQTIYAQGAKNIKQESRVNPMRAILLSCCYFAERDLYRAAPPVVSSVFSNVPIGR